MRQYGLVGVLDPDPIRDLFTDGARRLLDRAYGQPGRWQQTRLADPGPLTAAMLRRQGIDPRGPDNSSARGGKTRARPAVNARDRWTRGFIRCLYHQHRWHAADPDHASAGWRDRRMAPLPTWDLEIDVGRRLPGSRTPGSPIVAGRIVRIRIRPPLDARQVDALPYEVRTSDAAGGTGGRWSDPARRDWTAEAEPE